MQVRIGNNFDQKIESVKNLPLYAHIDNYEAVYLKKGARYEAQASKTFSIYLEGEVVKGEFVVIQKKNTAESIAQDNNNAVLEVTELRVWVIS